MRRSHHNIRRLETDSKKRPFLKTDPTKEQLQPLVVNSHYLPQEYEDWLVISVLGHEHWVGLPALSASDSDM